MYKRQTQAIVVTGFGLSRPKVVCGRGVFVLPIVQRADRLNMRLLKIDVKTPETTQLVDLVHICNVIYARRCAPVHPMIRNYMNTHGYFVRFYDGL